MDTWLVDIWLAHQRLIIAIGLVLLALAYRQILWLCGVIVVPNDSIGVVTKKFAVAGAHRNLPDGSIVALSGEAGYQADTLTPGLHLGLWPWQFKVELVKFLAIPPGKVGCVEACDGRPLPMGRIIARQVACDAFQDARAREVIVDLVRAVIDCSSCLHRDEKFCSLAGTRPTGRSFSRCSIAVSCPSSKKLLTAG